MRAMPTWNPIARKNSEGALMEPRVVERMEASSCWVADAKETERESNTIRSRGRPSQHTMPIEPTCIPTVWDLDRNPGAPTGLVAGLTKLRCRWQR